MTPDTGVLTTVLTSFLATFKAGFGPVKVDALALLGILTAIELTVAILFWVIKGEDALVGLIQKILLIGMFLFFVSQWPTLVNQAAQGFEQTGFKAGGAGAGATIALTNPSAIIDYGFAVTQPIQAEIDSLSSGTLGALQNIGLIMMLGWAEIGILMAFFLLAIQAFVTYLEFYIVAVLALILVPFGVLRHTSFIAEKAFGVVISHGVKLMVLSCIMGAAMPVLSSLSMPADPTIQMAWCMLLAAGAILFLAWHAPAVAGGMMAGGPALNAGTAAGTAIATGAAVLGAGYGGAWAASRASAAGMTSVKAAGAVQTGAQMGALDAALGGGGKIVQVGGAIAGVVQVAGNALTTPVRSVSQTMSQKLREGNLRAYDLARGTTLASESDQHSGSGTTTRGRAIPDALRSAQQARTVVPPQAHPQGGISAPIRHDDRTEPGASK